MAAASDCRRKLRSPDESRRRHGDGSAVGERERRDKRRMFRDRGKLHVRKLHACPSATLVGGSCCLLGSCWVQEVEPSALQPPPLSPPTLRRLFPASYSSAAVAFSFSLFSCSVMMSATIFSNRMIRSSKSSL